MLACELGGRAYTGLVALFDCSTGERMVDVRVSQPSEVSCLAFSADGQLLATGLDNGEAFVFQRPPVRLGRPLAAVRLCEH